MQIQIRLLRDGDQWIAWATRNGSTAVGFTGGTRAAAWQAVTAFILKQWR